MKGAHKMNYDANSIETLDFKSAIRSRIAMYMGSADNQGVLQCVREIITNSIDEATMGFGKSIKIDLFDNNKIRVEDDGRGCPFGEREDGTEALEAIYTTPHSGAKFNDKIFQNVAGMNGIGAKGVALSSDYFEVESYRDGKLAFLSLDKGIKKDFYIIDSLGTQKKTGTIVTFIPSQEVYNLEKIDIKFEEIKKMCEDWSYLSAGLSFILTNHITNETVTYLSKNGLVDLINKKSSKTLIKTPLQIIIKENNIEAEIVMSWTNSREEEWHVFTNGLENSEGGTPLTGIKTALTNFFKKKFKEDSAPDIIRKGLLYAVSCKIPNPSFANQTKTKVNNPELRGLCQRATTQMLENFEVKRREEFNKILELLTKELKAEIAADRARKQVLSTEKEINDDKKKRIILADKLKDCQIHGSNNGSILAICEGDSALGALVQARPIDRVALLPIRGKIISALKHEQEKIFQNEEVKAIFSALGCGFLGNYNSSKLRYQYVGIASDADVDGSAISNLITTLFYYMCPMFIEEGRLFRMKMPLFVLKYPRKVLYAFSESERDNLIELNGKPKEIGRKKGIGENSPEETRVAVFGDQRRWERINIYNKEEYSKQIEMLMGKSVDERKDFIIKNIDFSRISE
jgi:DNA gyrase subunit B